MVVLDTQEVTLFTGASGFTRTVDLSWSNTFSGNLYHEWDPNGTPAQDQRIQHVTGVWHRVG